MAVPGETTCHEVAPCMDGTWGDIPVESNTQFVDGSFAGTSDGSAKAPWTTIQRGIDAADAGAIVSVAAGTYTENIHIGVIVGSGKPVRLWGRCPALVEIVGVAPVNFAIDVRSGASKTEIRGIAIRGTGGIEISNAHDVVVDHVWVHDAAGVGVQADRTLGAAAFTMTGSLVERTRKVGVLISAADATIEGSVIRDTTPDTDGSTGRGINVQTDGGQRANVTLRGSLIEGNHDVGVYVAGSDALIEATAIRDTMARASDRTSGHGLELRDEAGQRATVTLRASVVERCRYVGVVASGSDLTIEATVVRDTLPQDSDNALGRGIAIQDHDGERAVLMLRASVMERNLETGVFVAGSDATIEGVIVRETSPQMSDGQFGFGIDVQFNHDTLARSTAAIRSTLVDASYQVGVSIDTSDAVLDGVLVHDTKARADGLFGDGIAVFAETGPSSAVVSRSRVQQSARAGLSDFGADVKLDTTTFECDAIQLDGEAYGSAPYSLQDLGGDICGCSGTPVVCQILSSGLAPPELPPELAP
jgi:hypothetical protein